ncbi:MAG TPA: glyoxalase superfamily protein [Vicinamibacterales bacterium]|nr:glyoxalase superfamily protein [Vicinamibacterales bacterium]
MSRELPPRPNLEHLKKQAKERLRELQLTRPDTRLADAQHAVAREYGFSSWPTLHAHVTGAVRDQTTHPLTGTWTWDADGSSIVDEDAPRHVMLSIDVDGDIVTIADSTINGSSREERNVNTIHVDGEERAQPHGYAIVATWVNTRALEAVGTKDGRLEGRVRYEVSDDGTTLTLSANERVIRLRRR